MTFEQLKDFAYKMRWNDGELCRQIGIARNTLYNYQGKGPSKTVVKIGRTVELACLALAKEPSVRL